MIRLLIILAALLLAGHACKGVCDTLQFHYQESYFAGLDNDRFWDPDESWRNKWADGEKANGERFPGSSTVFVATTDAWHLFQALQYALIRIALTILVVGYVIRRRIWWMYLACYFAIWLIQAGGFHLGYS